MGLLVGQSVIFRDSSGVDQLGLIAVDHGDATFSVLVPGDPTYLYGPITAPFAYSLDATPVPLGVGNYSVRAI